MAVQLAELDLATETQPSIVVHFHGTEVGLFRAEMFLPARRDNDCPSSSRRDDDRLTVP